MSYADNPIRKLEDEWLNRRSSVEALLGVLADPDLETPLAVGVYGAWGSGKTSVMYLLKAGLSKNHFSLWFDAWKYARQDLALWRALLLAVVEALGDKDEGLPRLLASEEDRKEIQEKLNELATSLYRSQTITEKGSWRVNWGVAVPFAVDLGLSAVTAGLWDKLGEATGAKAKLKELAGFFADKETKDAMQVIEREQATRYREQVSSLEQFQKELRKLIGTHIVEPGRRLYLFIDDLDRCLPEDAVGALEALKLFLDLPGCVFILGTDRHVVEQGIRVRYKEFELAGGLLGPVDPRQYLDKIIQIPFRLPPLDTKRMTNFIENWYQRNQGAGDKRRPELEYVRACKGVVATGVATNPRSVKRTVSVLRLMLKLHGVTEPDELDNQDRERTTEFAQRLAKLVVLQTSYDDLYNEVVERPKVLQDIEDRARERHRGAGTKNWFDRDGGERLRAMFALKPHFESLNEDQLRQLVYVAEIAEVSVTSGVLVDSKFEVTVNRRSSL